VRKRETSGSIQIMDNELTVPLSREASESRVSPDDRYYRSNGRALRRHQASLFRGTVCDSFTVNSSHFGPLPASWLAAPTLAHCPRPVLVSDPALSTESTYKSPLLTAMRYAGTTHPPITHNGYHGADVRLSGAYFPNVGPDPYEGIEMSLA
jgi:hypothetical protein